MRGVARVSPPASLSQSPPSFRLDVSGGVQVCALAVPVSRCATWGRPRSSHRPREQLLCELGRDASPLK